MFIPDPPYGILQGEEQSRDQISQQDMGRVVGAAQYFLHEKGTAIVFCSIQQFKVWHDMFKAHNFTVENVPFVIVNAPTNSRTGRWGFNMYNGRVLYTYF